MFRSGIYNLIGGVTRVAATLITIPVLLRVVGIEEYGLLTLAFASINLVALAEAGLPVAITVFIARDRAKHDMTGMSQTLTIGFAATATLATLAAAAIWLGGSASAQLFSSLDVTQRAAVAQSLQIGAFVVWVRLLQQLMVGVLQAFERYGVLNIVLTAQGVCANIGMLAIAWFGGRTVWLIGWHALVGVLVTLVYLRLCIQLLRPLRPRVKWHRARAREIALFSGYAWVSALGSALFSQADRLIVGGLLGLGPLGVYGAITSATTQINALSGLVVQPLMPSMSALTIGRGAADVVPVLFKRAWQTLSFVTLGLGGALFALAPLVLRLAAPDLDTPEHIDQLRLATGIYTIYSLNAFGYFVLLGTERARECMVVVIGSGLISLAMIAAGASSFGLTGAVVGNAGYMATLVLNLFALRGLPVNMRNLAAWITLPLIWFATVVCLSLLAPDRIAIMLGLFTVQNVVLAAWYIGSQRFTLLSRLPIWAGGKAQS